MVNRYSDWPSEYREWFLVELPYRCYIALCWQPSITLKTDNSEKVAQLITKITYIWRANDSYRDHPNVPNIGDPNR